MIFQSPDDSLTPRQSVAEILAQPLRLYFGLKDDALRDRAAELPGIVRPGAGCLDRRPGQLSGGGKQRVALARAFAAGPEIVLCDEITSALDVSAQAAVLDLLNDLKAEHGTAFVFVRHDLTVVRALSDRIAVLCQWRICEIGPAAAVYGAPSHPYTAVLLGAVLRPDPDHAPRQMAGDSAEVAPPPRGCPFQTRCPVKCGALCDLRRRRCAMPATATRSAATSDWTRCAGAPAADPQQPGPAVAVRQGISRAVALPSRP